MFKKILVAVDLSPRNEEIFTAGLDLAKQNNASLLLLHVPSSDAPESPTMPTLIGPDYYPSSTTASVMEIYEKLWRAYEEKGLEMLKGFAETARQAGVTIEYAQNAGAPGKTICQLATDMDVDLVVIGRRGHSGFNELIAGSVSNYVMHHAPCSVLIIQAGDPRRLNKPESELAASV
jgi:nucleotide-binding universal stress UspA family protein